MHATTTNTRLYIAMRDQIRSNRGRRKTSVRLLSSRLRSVALPGRQSGFTLTEIVVVGTLAAILAAVAIPTYSDYVTRGRLTEASSILADIRVRAEQHFQDNRTYSSFGCAVPTGARYFGYNCTVTSSGTAITVTASSLANQGLGASGAYAYTINETNLRRTTAFPGASGLPRNCWIVKKGETC